MARKGLIKLAICAVSGASFGMYAINIKRENVTNLFKPIAHIKAATRDVATNVWNDNWDCRQPNKTEIDEDKNGISSATRHIILIRHGQYYVNNKNDEDRRLTPLGCKQAKLTGQRLKELDLTYNQIIESTMTRAKETSALIQEYLPNVSVSQTDLLREGAPIPPEPSHPSWQPSEKHFFTEGARIEAAFRKYIHRASPNQKENSIDILVCHANVIRYFVCRALQFPPEGWLRMNLAHGSITWITIRPNGRVSIRCLGETGHMPVDAISNV